MKTLEIFRYTISKKIEETFCDYCGCDLFIGDTAYECADKTYCSKSCARNGQS